jgi:signal transduction histidine kinase
LEERERVARELHDGVCQELVGAACALEVLRRKLAARDAPEAAGAAKAAALVDRALREARSLARGREAAEVGEVGLPAALARLAEETEQVYGVTCGFAAAGSGVTLGAAAAGHLYRIAQEVVGNAARHGKARYVTVELATRADVVRLTVRDDGVGVGNATSEGAGMGLGTMAYRARVIGGALEVRAGECGGTVVECAVPMAAGR